MSGKLLTFDQGRKWDSRLRQDWQGDTGASVGTMSKPIFFLTVCSLLVLHPALKETWSASITKKYDYKTCSVCFKKHVCNMVLLISSFQSLSCVQLIETPWTAARQASLSITNCLSLLKLMSIESVIPSNHFILCHPILLPSILPSIRVFSSDLPVNIQDWFPLQLTGLISLQSKGFSRIFSNTTVQKHQFFGAQLSL